MKASHRPALVATILGAAWLAGACQSSPLRPSLPQPQEGPPAQTLVSLMGRVAGAAADPDSVSMPVSGATISIAIDENATFAAVTDENGWYEVAQFKGFVTVTVTKEGYETEVRSMELAEDTVLNFELKRAE
jgi:carboxypeptidase family protein